MLEPHPFADLFPLIEGAEFDELVTSIRERGLLHPIVLADGKILDGRNRYRACMKLGITPQFHVMDKADDATLAAYVAAENLHRRHLTDAQRAAIAGRLIASKTMTLDGATKALNVRRRNASKATTVHRHGSPKVIDMMTRGAVTVAEAHRLATGAVSRSDAGRALQAHATNPGRPPGKASVVKLRRLLEDFGTLIDREGEIVEYWPGDPAINVQLSQVSSFLASLLRQTREYDGAAAIA